MLHCGKLISTCQKVYPYTQLCSKKKNKKSGAAFQTECPVSINEPIYLTIPWSHPELETKQHCFPNNGDENLISSTTGNENEAASPDASQIRWVVKGGTRTQPCTDCSPQETISEHPPPSGSTLPQKSQELESDPTNKPHAVLLSQLEQGKIHY